MGKQRTNNNWGEAFINATPSSSAVMQHNVENKYDNYLLPGVDQNGSRARQQGWGSELLNGLASATLKIPSNIIGNVAAIADIEDYYNQDDEVGNWLSRAMQDFGQSIDEEFAVYQKNPGEALDFSDSAWWMKNMSQVIGSGVEFALTGSGLASVTGKALSLMGATGKVGTALNLGTNVLALNQAEALLSAQDVYKKAYEDNKLKGFGEEEAKRIAADAAAYTININRLNIPLNLTSSMMFLRTPRATRQLVSNINRGNTLKRIGLEGIQEYGEETINHIAEQEGGRRAEGGKYDINNTIRDILSAEGIEAGLLGFLGGVVQTGATEAVNEVNGKNKEERARYNTQQEILKQYETYRTSQQGQQSFKDIIENIAVNASFQNQIYEAEKNGNDTQANTLRDKLLLHHALTAFKNGTTGKLVEQFDLLIQQPNAKDKLGEDYYNQVTKAKKKIEQWENAYDKISTRLPENRVEPMFTAISIQDSLLEEGEELKKQSHVLQQQLVALETSGADVINHPKTAELAQLMARGIEVSAELKDIDEDIKEITSKDFDLDKYKQKKYDALTNSGPTNTQSTQTGSAPGSSTTTGNTTTGTPGGTTTQGGTTTGGTTSTITKAEVDKRTKTYSGVIKTFKTAQELDDFEKGLNASEDKAVVAALKTIIEDKRKELKTPTRTTTDRLTVKDLPTTVQNLIAKILDAKNHIKLRPDGKTYVDTRTLGKKKAKIKKKVKTKKVVEKKLSEYEKGDTIIIEGIEFSVVGFRKTMLLSSEDESDRAREIEKEAEKLQADYIVKTEETVEEEVEEETLIDDVNTKIYKRVSTHIGNEEVKYPIEEGESMEAFKKRLIEVEGLVDKGKDTPLTNALRIASSLRIGTAVDKLVRDYFNGEEMKYSNYYNLITDEKAYEFFVEQLKELDAYFISKGEVVLADDVLLHNDELKIAGTVDLMTVDKDGVVRIYDMKTMSSNQLTTAYGGDSKTKYDTSKYGTSNRQKHQKQLSMYRILLARTYNVIAKELGIIPIEVSYKPGDESTSKAVILTDKGNRFINHPPLDEVEGATLGKKAPNTDTGLEAILTQEQLTAVNWWNNLSISDQNSPTYYLSSKLDSLRDIMYLHPARPSEENKSIKKPLLEFEEVVKGHYGKRTKIVVKKSEESPIDKRTLANALGYIIKAGKASADIIADKLKVGLAEATRIYNELSKKGFISGEKILKNADGTPYVEIVEDDDEDGGLDGTFPNADVYDRGQDASSTPYRTTGPEYGKALSVGKENEVRWQKFVDDFNDDANNYLFKVLTSKDGEEYYNALSFEQKLYHRDIIKGAKLTHKETGTVLTVTSVNNDKIYIKDSSSKEFHLFSKDLLEGGSKVADFLVNGKEIVSQDKPGTQLQLTDRYGKPILVDGKPLYTTMLTRRTNRDGKKVVSDKNLGRKLGILTEEESRSHVPLSPEKQAEIEEAYKQEYENYDSLRVSINEGNTKWLQVERKARGAFNYSTPAKVSDRIESIYDAQFKIHSGIEDQVLTKDPVTGQTLRAGVTYVKKDGYWQPIISRNLNEKEISDIIDKLQGLVQASTDTEIASNKEIEQFMKYFIYVKSKRPTVMQKHDIVIVGNSVIFGDDNNGKGTKLNFPIGNSGEQIVLKNKLEKFLADKLRNVDNRLLQESSDPDTKIQVGDKLINYRDFLFNDDTLPFHVVFPPSNEPTWVNSYMEFSSRPDVTPIVEAPVVEEEQPTVGLMGLKKTPKQRPTSPKPEIKTTPSGNVAASNIVNPSQGRSIFDTNVGTEKPVDRTVLKAFIKEGVDKDVAIAFIKKFRDKFAANELLDEYKKIKCNG